jgi:hypothetical protein
MIEDLLQMKAHLDSMIETYKDLHPDEEYETHDRGNNTHLDGMSEYNEKQTALKRIREGYYENKFRKSQRKEAPRPSQGQPALCVYGDS